MLRLVAVLLSCVLFAGCASLRDVSSDVSTYSHWSAERKPGIYVFDRLPSQQAHAGYQVQLESAAAPALLKAGFKPLSADSKIEEAEYTVQVGARVSLINDTPFDDPFWWRTPSPRSSIYLSVGRGMYAGGQVGMMMDSSSYDREAVVLIRDRRTGAALYEVRVSNVGASSSMDSVLLAMFWAALQNFPYGGIEPRRVTVSPEGLQ